jgi:DNA polymerase-3 subunit gamma/tau
VGKTTTARIVAKGLNCIGPPGADGPTIEPCGACGPCRAIAEGRHVDVLEYDAASNTQVDKMREILAAVPYRPTEARYKVIIFDEVHMLSSQSFNALLKTLEEPPPHVKFIFATTEIRKVPVTILSRCQRYDLRRIEPEVMIDHLARIVAAEGQTVSHAALALITRAAEGSVRDALSLLDQAIAHGAGGGETAGTDAEQVRAMLGLADRGRVLDLFDLVMRGDAAGALAELAAQYADGADPAAVLRDLAEATHWISVIRITPETADDPTVPPDQRDRGREMAGRLPMRALSRMWQMLLRAIEEVGQAPNAMMAAEMAIIRLTHVADLPDPEQLLRRLQSAAAGGPGPAAPAGMTAGGATASAAAPVPQGPVPHVPVPQAPIPRAQPPAPSGLTAARPSAGGALPALAQGAALPARFDDLVAMIRARRDLKLLHEVETGVRLVAFGPARIEFEPAPDAPRDLAARLAQRLGAWTGVRWGVSVVGAGGAPTLAEQQRAADAAARHAAEAIPLVQAVLATFPGARIVAVRSPDALADQAAAEALPEVEDEWDPFEAG